MPLASFVLGVKLVEGMTSKSEVGGQSLTEQSLNVLSKLLVCLGVVKLTHSDLYLQKTRVQINLAKGRIAVYHTCRLKSAPSRGDAI